MNRPVARDVALGVGAVLGAVSLVTALLALVLDLRVLSFRSGSMSPAIDTGALAVAQKVPAADLEVGDVVSVRTATGSRVTHRVIDVVHREGEAVLELRGDANAVTDPTPYEVAGADRVLFSVPWLGRVVAVLTGPLGLFALGLYAAFLLRELLPRRGRPRGSARHRARHRADRRAPHRALPVTSAVLLLVTAGTLHGRGPALWAPTWAAWHDIVTTSGSTFATGSVPAPATFSCGLVGFFSVNFSWAAVPGATSYTLHYGSGGASTTTVTGTSTSVVTVISNGTAWVQANRNFGATTWTSVASPTRTYSVLAISICS